MIGGRSKRRGRASFFNKISFDQAEDMLAFIWLGSIDARKRFQQAQRVPTLVYGIMSSSQPSFHCQIMTVSSLCAVRVWARCLTHAVHHLLFVHIPSWALLCQSLPTSLSLAQVFEMPWYWASLSPSRLCWRWDMATTERARFDKKRSIFVFRSAAGSNRAIQ